MFSEARRRSKIIGCYSCLLHAFIWVGRLAIWTVVPQTPFLWGSIPQGAWLIHFLKIKIGQSIGDDFFAICLTSLQGNSGSAMASVEGHLHKSEVSASFSTERETERWCEWVSARPWPKETITAKEGKVLHTYLGWVHITYSDTVVQTYNT